MIMCALCYLNTLPDGSHGKLMKKYMPKKVWKGRGRGGAQN